MASQASPFASTDPAFGLAQGEASAAAPFVSTDPQFGLAASERQPDFTAHAVVPSGWDLAKAGMGGTLQEVNPFPMIAAAAKGLWHEAQATTEAAQRGHIGDAMGHATSYMRAVPEALASTHLATAAKAWEALKAGRLTRATAYGLASIVPLLGPEAANIGEELEAALAGQDSTKIAHAAGRVLGILAPFGLKYVSEAHATGSVLPTAAKVAAAGPDEVHVPGVLANSNADQAAAVDWGTARGIPVSAATATENPVIRGIEKAAEHTSLAGAYLGRRAGHAEAEGFTRVGRELAADTNARPASGSPSPPGPAIDAIGAAERVTNRLQQAIADHAGTADTAYDTLRQAEAAPANVTLAPTVQPGTVRGGGTIPVTTTEPMGLAVDLRAEKAALQPIYEQLLREAKLVPLQGKKAQALTALDRLMTGPDVAPLSVVDKARSQLLRVVGEKGTAGLTEGQGIIAKTAKTLDAKIQARALQAGPDVLQALTDGRAATKAKYAVADLLDEVQSANGEPSAVYRKLTANHDANVRLLEELARVAPEEVPHIGRAYLDTLIDTATAEGGFDRAKGLFATWQNLGPETKRVLFPDAALRGSLDNFFLLAKRASESPNPSGSAYVGGLLAHGYLFRDPLSGLAYEIAGGTLTTLLHAPSVVKLLTKGFTIKLGNKPAAAALVGQIKSAAGEGAVRIRETADEDPTATPAHSGRY